MGGKFRGIAETKYDNKRDVARPAIGTEGWKQEKRANESISNKLESSDSPPHPEEGLGKRLGHESFHGEPKKKKDLGNKKRLSFPEGGRPCSKFQV